MTSEATRTDGSFPHFPACVVAQSVKLSGLIMPLCASCHTRAALHYTVPPVSHILICLQNCQLLMNDFLRNLPHTFYLAHN